MSKSIKKELRVQCPFCTAQGFVEYIPDMKGAKEQAEKILADVMKEHIDQCMRTVPCLTLQ